MKEQDRGKFAAIILGAAELYDKSPSKNAMELWWNALKHLEIDQVETGISKAIQDPDRPRFMPQPADVIKYATPPKSALIAWTQVERAMNAHGCYATVQFSDGVINAVIKDMGGWPWLCSQNINEPWTQKEFERRYEAYRACGEQLHEPLLGIHEKNNRVSNFLEYVPDTILISDGGGVTMLPPHLPDELPGFKGPVKMLAEKLSM
jgi:hypothetical protein